MNTSKAIYCISLIPNIQLKMSNVKAYSIFKTHYKSRFLLATNSEIWNHWRSMSKEQQDVYEEFNNAVSQLSGYTILDIHSSPLPFNIVQQFLDLIQKHISDLHSIHVYNRQSKRKIIEFGLCWNYGKEIYINNEKVINQTVYTFPDDAVELMKKIFQYYSKDFTGINQMIISRFLPGESVGEHSISAKKMFIYNYGVEANIEIKCISTGVITDLTIPCNSFVDVTKDTLDRYSFKTKPNKDSETRWEIIFSEI